MMRKHIECRRTAKRASASHGCSALPAATTMMTEYRAVQTLVAEVFDGVFAEPAADEDEISLSFAERCRRIR